MDASQPGAKPNNVSPLFEWEFLYTAYRPDFAFECLRPFTEFRFTTLTRPSLMILIPLGRCGGEPAAKLEKVIAVAIRSVAKSFMTV